MKNIFTALLFIASTITLNSQVNQMVSDSAYFVMEVDLGKVVKSVPIEEINKLEFVQSLMKNFKDDNNNIQDLSSLGVDFSSKLIVFNIDRDAYSSVSVIVPIKERQEFLKLFSPDQQIKLEKNNSIVRDELIISIDESTCIMSMMKWSNDYFREKTRMIFEDNDWELPDNFYNYSQYDYIEDDFYGIEEAEESIEYEEIYIDEEYDEIIEVETIEEEETIEYEVEEIISEYEILQMELENKFQKILDSITKIEKAKIAYHHTDLINSPSNNLSANDDLYRKVSNTNADAKIYMNPIMNINLMNDFMYYPIKNYMEDELKEMRQFAFINFNPEGIQLDWKIQVSENLGAVMKEASSKKMDKNLLKYIPDYAQGIALYNVNGFGAYDKFKEIYMPILDDSDNAEMLLTSAVWSTLDEFIDVEAVASVYPPKVLVSYAGFKEVELSRVTYEYDEESFEYTEVDTTYMEKIPMMTFALSNERAYLLKKYLKAFQKLESEKIIYNGEFYTINDGPMQLGIPYYIAITDDIVIVTNDQNVVSENMNGYSKKAFDRKIYNKAKKAKMFYAHMDFSTITSDLADLGLIYDKEKYMKLFYDKTGKVDVEMTSISKNQAHYSVNINTNEKFQNGGYFLFELMNSIYLFSK